VDVEGHGREYIFEGIDLSRTVGWFTSMVPVILQLEKGNDWGAILQGKREQLRRIPNGGLGYGMLRYLCGDAVVAQRLRPLPHDEVCFNYLGQFDRISSLSAPSRRGV
jgi:hypothetical protein